MGDLEDAREDRFADFEYDLHVNSMVLQPEASCSRRQHGSIMQGLLPCGDERGTCEPQDGFERRRSSHLEGLICDDACFQVS